MVDVAGRTPHCWSIAAYQITPPREVHGMTFTVPHEFPQLGAVVAAHVGLAL